MATAAKTKSEKKKARRPKARHNRRTEQVFVECSVSPHSDLTRQAGVLTLDFSKVDGKPHTATFDPADDSVDNAIISVYGCMRTDKTIAIQSEGPKWRFTVLCVSVDGDEHSG